jgi:hypothetical protein
MDTERKPWAAEEEELQALLNAGVFARAPTLAALLEYVCRRTFAGEGHLIKEYNIAVEALGRPPDFNQKKDAIVRVEAHRLRKRLREFYAGEGASHQIQIEIPTRGYTPVFRRLGEIAEDPGQPEPEQPILEDLESLPEMPSAGPPAKRSWVLVVSLLVVLASGLATLVAWAPWRTGGRQPVAPAGQKAPMEAVSEIRIACGSSAPLTDLEGRVWMADTKYLGGEAHRAEALEVQGTQIPELFRSWRQGSFQYRIPLKEGVYELTLAMLEPATRPAGGTAASETSRLFDILINGEPVLSEFDLFADAGGPGIPVWRVYRDIRPDKDGWLAIEFRDRVGGAVVNGISIVPGMEGRLRPIRIAARETPYTDSTGQFWSEDRYFSGGRLVTRVETVQGTDDPEIFRGERYGRFKYTIPLPPDSTYTLILHFAETWWGGTGVGGVGSRLFDILANGKTLEQNFDVYREARGAFRAIRRVYRGLQPRPSGKLVLEFIPSKNYGFINAIEILDEHPRTTQASRDY